MTKFAPKKSCTKVVEVNQQTSTGDITNSIFLKTVKQNLFVKHDDMSVCLLLKFADECIFISVGQINQPITVDCFADFVCRLGKLQDMVIFMSEEYYEHKTVCAHHR